MKKEVNIILLASLLFILALLVRFLPLVKFSPEPATFRSYMLYSHLYLEQMGHLPKAEDIEVYNRFSSQARIATQRYPFLVFPSMLILLVGTPYPSWESEFLLSLSMAFPLYFVALVLAHRRKEKFSLKIPLLALFSIVATPYFISYLCYRTTTIGHLVIILFTYLYLRFFVEERLPFYKLLVILFGSFLAITYFTGSSAFLCILGIICVLELLYTKRMHNLGVFAIVLIVFLSYLMYHSTARFGGLVKIGEAFFDLLLKGERAETWAFVQPYVQSYLTSTTFANKIRLSISYLLAYLPLFLFVTQAKRIFLERRVKWIPAFALILSLIPIGLLTYFAVGKWGGYLPEYGTLTSVIIALLIYRYKIIKGYPFKLFLIVIGVSILISSLAYIKDENRYVATVTYQEAKGAQFATLKISPLQVIFTDFRLASPIVGRGHFLVTGVDTTASLTEVKRCLKQLHDIYWGANPSRALNALSQLKIDNREISYFFFSKQMCKELPGIRTYSLNFKPASYNSIKALSQVSNVIYSNSEAIIFLLEGGKK